mgnify:FL=1
MVKEVLVIFKTHLDIGFTDLAKNVKKHYINTFIPNAIKVGYELKDTNTPFIWTTGSYLIWEALKEDKDQTLTKAIKDGIISWHGLPCTTHTELMSRQMFEYGLSLSQKLDRLFGKKTTGAKMTDVPGHTKAVIPLLKKAGIDFLHIGINTATPVPPVPEVFKWKYGGDSINVVCQSGYGAPINMGDFVIYIAHTHDNNGPQSADEVKKLYAELKTQYPGAVIRAATFSDAAECMREVKNLPVVENEIGDTWIHGVGTDPKKVSMYKQILRNIEQKGIGDTDLADSLMLVAEHTWGVNTNVYFKYYKDYGYDEFKSYENNPDRKFVESSWQEQRDYVTKAAKQLKIDLNYTVKQPDLTGFNKFDGEFDTDFEISWQLFDSDDYIRYMKVYLQFTPQNIGWACADYMKLGMPKYKGGIYTPKVCECYKKENKTVYKLEFDEELKNKYGLPYFWVEQQDGKINVMWFNKGALRLPNAFWLKFKNIPDDNWQIRKLGEWINADDIIGSPLIAATDYGVKNSNTEIVSYDAALVAPYGRRLLDYDLHPNKQDLYFNLYNNIWNTNFCMWNSDNSKFEFEIK